MRQLKTLALTRNKSIDHGQSGKVNGVVYQFSYSTRRQIMDNDMEILLAMGIAQAINSSRTGVRQSIITGGLRAACQ